MRPSEKSESHQPIILPQVPAALSRAVLIWQAKIRYRWVHASLKPGKSLQISFQESSESTGELVRIPQDQIQNFLWHPSNISRNFLPKSPCNPAYWNNRSQNIPILIWSLHPFRGRTPDCCVTFSPCCILIHKINTKWIIKFAKS